VDEFSGLDVLKYLRRRFYRLYRLYARINKARTLSEGGHICVIKAPTSDSRITLYWGPAAQIDSIVLWWDGIRPRDQKKVGSLEITFKLADPDSLTNIEDFVYKKFELTGEVEK
jgi:hypothetical protein